MRLRTDKDAWLSLAQPYELAHWRGARPAVAGNPGQVFHSMRICQALELNEELIAGRNVLDVGCGPTGRLCWLEPYKQGATFWALDPLLPQYRDLPGANLAIYDYQRDAPVEEHQADFIGLFDVVVSINALDHGYDLPLALGNLRSYLRSGGRAVISMDCVESDREDVTHPIQVSRDEADAVIRQAGFSVDHCDPRGCYPMAPGSDECRVNWGRGVHWHWWLRV